MSERRDTQRVWGAVVGIGSLGASESVALELDCHLRRSWLECESFTQSQSLRRSESQFCNTWPEGGGDEPSRLSSFPWTYILRWSASHPRVTAHRKDTNCNSC